MSIAKIVAENYEDEEMRDTFINISLDLCVLPFSPSTLESLKHPLTIRSRCSVLEQPMKIPFVAATSLVAYNLKPELGSEVLNKATTALQKYILSGSWREVKLLLRFLGGLQAVFEGDGIFSLLEELFARAVDLQTASSEDVSGLPLRDNGFTLT